MELDKVKIGERMRKIRKEDLKFSLEEMAEKCGITANHLGRLERGKFLITIRILNKFCIATGVSSEYLLYGKTKNNSITREKIENCLDKATIPELKKYYKMLSILNDSF